MDRAHPQDQRWEVVSGEVIPARPNVETPCAQRFKGVSSLVRLTASDQGTRYQHPNQMLDSY